MHDLGDLVVGNVLPTPHGVLEEEEEEGLDVAQCVERSVSRPQSVVMMRRRPHRHHRCTQRCRRGAASGQACV